MKNLTALLFAICVFYNLGFSQQNSPSVDWKRMETPHFEVVFPSNLQGVGQRMANELEHYYMPVSASLEKQPKRISVFLFGQSAVSNGYVRLFPRYSAWYPIPGPDAAMGGQDEWFRSTGIHEFRHVVQFDKANQGMTRFFSRIFGDLIRAGLAWSVPSWFVEGDAVCIETALTHEGRGRLPSFEMPVRASVLTGKKMSYEQAYLGSYKAYFPSQYHIGYLLANYSRQVNGSFIWSKVVDKYSKYPFWPYAFSLAHKRLTGDNLRHLYAHAMDSLGQAWQEKQTDSALTAFTKQTKEQRVWTSFYNPQPDDDGAILAIRSGYIHPQELVQIDSVGAVNRLFAIDGQEFSYRSGRVVWAESVADLRWEERNYSDIVLRDLRRHTSRRLTSNGRYYSPVLSPNGLKIAAVSYSDSLLCSLEVLDAFSGKLLLKKQLPNNETLRNPAWNATGDSLIFTAALFDGASIQCWNLEKNTLTTLKSTTTEPISKPQFWQNYVLYHSGASGRDQIWALNRTNNRIFKVLTSEFGAMSPEVRGAKLYFQDYSAGGFRAASLPLDTTQWQAANQTPIEGIQFYKKLAEMESGPVFDKAVADSAYRVQGYSILRNLVHFHSIMAFPDLPRLNILALSRDKLNTLDIEAGAIYDNNERNWGYTAGITYKGFFPKLSVSSEYWEHEGVYEVKKQDFELLRWRNPEVVGTVTLPFNFSHGPLTTHLNLWTSYHYSQIRAIGNPYIKPKDYNLITYGLQFYNFRAAAKRDVDYRHGFVTVLQYKHDLNQSPAAHLASASVRMYFPGFALSHSLKLTGNYETKNTDGYKFASTVNYIRGYTYLNHNKFAMASADYKFPIAYPDLRLGSLLYLNRIRASIFADVATANGTAMSAIGSEWFVDFYVFQIKYPLSIGVRYSYLPDSGHQQIQGLFAGVNFNVY